MKIQIQKNSKNRKVKIILNNVKQLINTLSWEMNNTNVFMYIVHFYVFPLHIMKVGNVYSNFLQNENMWLYTFLLCIFPEAGEAWDYSVSVRHTRVHFRIFLLLLFTGKWKICYNKKKIMPPKTKNTVPGLEKLG